MTVPTGLCELSATDYHQDALDPERPSLSASLAKVLINQSPAHARAAHPRLNPNYQRVEEDKFSLGTAAHALFLEGDAGVEVCNLIHPKTGEFITEWRTDAAKEAKSVARQYGRIPMLAHEYDKCVALVAALREQCDSHTEGPFFTDGTAEKTLVWEDEYGVLCRARLDWLRDDHSAIDDLKTSKASARPESWADKTMWSFNAPLQAAFYRRGARKVLGCEPEFRFVVIEVAPPYQMSVVSLDTDTWAFADKQVSYALRKWATCLRNDAWPGYEQKVAYAQLPAYIENKWLEREVREATAA